MNDDDRTLSERVTSRSVTMRAIRAHRHLYRISACDDPDLGMNVAFAVEHQGLMRLAAAEPWPLPDSVTARVLPLVAVAERTVDPWAATECLSGFAQAVQAALERRGRPRGRGVRRRMGEVARTMTSRGSSRRDIVVAGPTSVLVRP